MHDAATFLSTSLLIWRLRNNWEEPDEDHHEFYDNFATMNLEENFYEHEPMTLSELAAPPVSNAHVPSISSSFVVDSKCSKLLPGLPDSILRDHMWSRLMQKNPIAMLQRLRRVNRAWKQMVESTVEWTALEFTRLDTPGYHRYAADQTRKWWVRFRKRDRRERFASEMRHIQSVLEEPRYPMFNLVWYEGTDKSIQMPLEVGDSELKYYSKVAMEMFM